LCAKQERRRKQKDQERLLAEKQEELERLQMEELSLTKVIGEQTQLIAKLSDSSSGAAFSF
jgi:intraflagellar transport protein 20